MNPGVFIGAGVLITTVIVLVYRGAGSPAAETDAPVAIPQCTYPGRRTAGGDA